MRSIRFLFLFLLVFAVFEKSFSQCSSGCTTTPGAGSSIFPTAANQVICITQPGSYSYESNFSNVLVKVCADDVTFTQFRMNTSAADNGIETWGANTTIGGILVEVDTFFLTTHSTNTRVTSINANKMTKFITTTGADLTIEPQLSPGKRIFFDLGPYSTINTNGITSNAGGDIYIGKEAVFNSSGNLILQDQGRLFNTGTVNVDGDVTIQGGANAMNNYCGFATINIGGTFIVNSGTMRNAGSIIADDIRVNSDGGPVYMLKGAIIEANNLESFNQPNLFRGDSIETGECATFSIDSYGGSWNGALTNSSKINYCGPAVDASRLGSATVGCNSCTSAPAICIIPCTKPNAGADQLFCTPSGDIDLNDATEGQVWYASGENSISSDIDPVTGEVTNIAGAGIFDYVLFDTSGTANSSCLDTVSLTINQDPNPDLTISGGIYCNNATSATIQIQGAEPDVDYTVLLGSTVIGTGSIPGNTPANLDITIPLSSFSSGENIVNVSADITGCATVNLIDTAAVVINPEPDNSLLINGGVFCSDESLVSIEITGAEPNVFYSVILGGSVIGSGINSTGSPQNLIIDNISTASVSNGNNIVSVEADIAGCTTITLDDTALIVKNPLPDNSLTINGSMVCSNQATTNIRIVNAEPEVTYTAILNGSPVGTGTNSINTPATISIPIDVSDLSTGLNIIEVEADIEGCATVSMADTAGIRVIPNPENNLEVTGGIICSNIPTTTITISNAEPNVTYSAYRNSTKLGDAISNVTGELDISIPTSLLTNGNNTITVTGEINGCAVVALLDTANISKVPNPGASLTITGETVCSSASTAFISIQGAQNNVTYSAYLGTTLLNSGTHTGPSGPLSIGINVADLSDGLNIISVRADINGCATVNLTDTAGIVKVPNPDNSLTIDGNIVCSNETDTYVTIRNTDPDVTYTAFLGSNPLGSSTNTGKPGDHIQISIPNNRLTVGENVISVTADIAGCATVNLTDTAAIEKVPNPSANNTVNGNILCSSDANSTSIRVLGALPNVTYTAYLGSDILGTGIRPNSNTGPLDISFPTSAINNGENIITVTADIFGCATVNVTDTALVTLDPELSPGSISVTNTTICSGTSPDLLNGTLPSGGLSPLTYTWQYSSDSLNWTNISGSNTPGPLSSVPSISSNTYYRRFVKSRVCTANSAGLAISVTGLMVGGDIQATEPDICKDAVPGIIDNVTDASGGTGSGIQYQWQFSTDGASWSDIASADAVDYQPGALNIDTYFRRKATNGNGVCDTTYAGPVLISIYNPLNPGSIQPGDTIVCDGSEVTIKNLTLPSNGSPGYNYIWQSSEAPFNTWSDVPASDSPSLTIGSINASTRFRRIAVNQCSTDTTDAFYEIQVLPNLITSIEFEPVPALICNIDELTVTAFTENAGPARTIDWYYNGSPFLINSGIDSVYTDQGSWNNLDTITAVVIADPNKLCTTPGDTAQLVLNVNYALGNNQITSENQKACAVSDLSDITGTAATGTLASPAYIWQVSADSTTWTDIAGAENQNYLPEIASGVYYYRRIAVSAGACPNDTTGSSIEVRLDGDDFDPGTVTATPEEICQDFIPSLITTPPSGGVEPYTYQWFRSTDNTTYVAIDGADSSGYNPPLLSESTYYIRRVYTATDLCEYPTTPVLVKIDKIIDSTTNKFEPLEANICFGADAGLIDGLPSDGEIQPATYQWISSPNGMDSWEDVSGEVNEDLQIGNIFETTYFKRIITSTGACSNDTSNLTVEIVVDPKLMSGEINPVDTICEGSSVELTASNPSGGRPEYTYQWQQSENDTDWVDFNGQTDSSLNSGSLYADIYYRRIVISGLEVCKDTTNSYKVVVDPEVDPGKIGLDQQFCGKDTLILDYEMGASGGTSISYSWQISNSETGTWNDIPNSDSPGMILHKRDLPQFEVYYFRRLAKSSACEESSQTISVSPCLNPVAKDYYDRMTCGLFNYQGDIVTEGDSSKNGGGLIPSEILIKEPSNGEIYFLNTVEKRFGYQPDSGFVGIDTVVFEVCDTSIFKRCSPKTIFIEVWYNNRRPDIRNEYHTEYRNISISGNILSNDSDPDSDTLIVLEPAKKMPKHGTIYFDYLGDFEYRPNYGFTGKDSLIVTVCDMASYDRCDPILCEDDTLAFTILPNRVFIPDGFSPNDDNNHDVFVFTTDAPSTIEFMVYNRWGNLVYENTDYKNDWDGVANQGIVIGKGVPDGTYYIYYNINDGEFEGFKYITINR